MSASPAASSAATLSPMLSVRNGARALDFYAAAFGAQILIRMDGEDGSVVAELGVGASHFWVADESPDYKNFSPETLGGGTVRLILVVPDPDAAFARAVSAGATVVHPVRDENYHWRVGRVMDPFGHHWEIGRTLNATGEPG